LCGPRYFPVSKLRRPFLSDRYFFITVRLLRRRVKMTRLSCHRFRSNEVRPWLSVIAYNLGNLWRRLALPSRIDNWSLTSLQQRLVKTGGRLVRHARYCWLLLAESDLTRGCLEPCSAGSRPFRPQRGNGPLTESDFVPRADSGRKRVEGIGRTRSGFGLWYPLKWRNWPLPSALEAANTENPVGYCLQRRSGVNCRVSRSR
jgi:hypothetical protein